LNLCLFSGRVIFFFCASINPNENFSKNFDLALISGSNDNWSFSKKSRFVSTPPKKCGVSI